MAVFLSGLIKVILGLLGLGVVVFVHELGHFLAARLCRIDVEAFSIGWGKALLKKKVGDVEYRLGMFPMGGYCKMRDDGDFNEVWENMQKGIAPTPGSYFAASPQRRMLVCVAGPLFNLIFAALVLAVIWGAGFQVSTQGNKIVLASEVLALEDAPADRAGLITGDRIVAIDGKETKWFHEMLEKIATNPDKNLLLTVERDGELLYYPITPSLEKNGIGRIGIVSWIDPVVQIVKKDSPAFLAGLVPGDRITEVAGHTIRNTADLDVILQDNPESISVEYERGGELLHTTITMQYPEKGEVELGIGWELYQYRNPPLGPVAAMAKGFAEAGNSLALVVKGFRLLFKDIDHTKAVSGPVRITYMMGDAATAGFGSGIASGFRSLGSFIAIISIAVGVMNLLPIPIVDGGMIVLYCIEMIRRKPITPRATAAFQTVGIVLIAGLMLFAFYGDILFLAGR